MFRTPRFHSATFFATAVLCLWNTFSSWAQDGSVTLEATYAPGKEYHMTLENNIVMQIPFGEQSMEQKVNMTQSFIIQSWAPDEEADAQAATVLKATLDHVVMKTTAMGMDMTYDSKQTDGGANLFAPMFADILGRLVRLELDSEGNVLSVEAEGNAAGGESPAPAGAGGLGAMSAKLGPEVLEQFVVALTASLPGNTVKPGDTWSTDRELAAGSYGAMMADLTFTYTGDEEMDGHPVAVIETVGKFAGEVDLEAAGVGSGDTAGGLGPVSAIQIDESTISGKLCFDKALGIQRYSEQSMDLTITMPNPLGGEAPMTVPMKQKTVIHLDSVADIKE